MTQRDEIVAVTTLDEAAYNPRIVLRPEDAEYQQIRGSLLEFGQVVPVVANRLNRRIVGGHQRIRILKDLSVGFVWVRWVELDLEREKALNLALNKIQGEWDMAKLAVVLPELGGYAPLTGFFAPTLEAEAPAAHQPPSVLAVGWGKHVTELPAATVERAGKLVGLYAAEQGIGSSLAFEQLLIRYMAGHPLVEA